MLAFIRKWLTSWPVLALLGLVLLAFVITGVGDPFGGGGAGGSLATVGGQKVSEAEVLQRFERVVAQAREQTPGLTQAEAARQGGLEQVVESLATVAALNEFAAEHGVTVSKAAVDGAIASIGAFQIGGKFDQATYERLLGQQRMTDRELKEGMRTDILRKLMLVPVAAGAQVPREIAAPYARLLLDLHEGAAATIPPPAVGAPTPSQLSTFYATNKARFTAPERRSFRYAIVDRAGIGAKVTVTDAELRASFDKDREAYGAVEQRRLSQLVLQDEAKARAFAAAMRGGQSFAAAAAAASGASASDVSLGLLTRDKYAAASNPALAGQVFAAPSGGLIGPVKTDFGWNVVRIDEIVAPQGRTFEALRPLVLAKLRDSKTEAALAEIIAKIEDGLADGKSFADTVKDNGLTAATAPPVAKDGAGAPPEAVPVAAKAFDLDPADGAQVVDLGSGRFALVELGDVVAAAPPPLAQIMPRVTAAWTLDARARGARQVADQIIAETAKGGSFTAALAKRKLAARPIKGRRVDAMRLQQVPAPIAAFLNLGAGKTAALAADDGSTVLVHVDRIVPGDIATLPPLLEATRQQLVQAAPEETAGAFAKAVERAVGGVKLNPAAISATKKRLLGDSVPAQ